VEKDPLLFKAALSHGDFSRTFMHPGVELFVGSSTDDLFFAFCNFFTLNPGILEYSRSLKFIIMPAVHLVENSTYGDAYRTIKNAMIHLFQHLGNDPYDALLGVHQTIANLLPLIEDPASSPLKVFPRKAGIVIGAGPSLNKNIHLLKEAQNKALLVAVDAALKPLLNLGIQPHLVTNIERTAAVNAFFVNLERQDDTFFVFSPVAAPETYRAFPGPKIIAQRYTTLMNWLDIPKGY